MLRNRFFKNENIIAPTKPKGIKRKEIKPRIVTETLEEVVSKNKNLKSKPIPAPKKRLTPEDYLAKHPDLQKYFNSTVDMLHKERRNFGAPSVCVLVKYFNDIEFSDEYSSVLKENCLKEFPEYGPVFGVGKYQEEVPAESNDVSTEVQRTSNVGTNKRNGVKSTRVEQANKHEKNTGKQQPQPEVNSEAKSDSTEKPNELVSNGANKYPACTKCGTAYKKGVGPVVCIKCNMNKAKAKENVKPKS